MPKIYIKNMVCQRCVMTVEELFRKLDIDTTHVTLGEVEVESEITPEKQKELKKELEKVGFVLLDDRKSQLVDKIKHLILDYIRQGTLHKEKLSSYITSHIHYDYSYISDLFSSIEGITIEQYLIRSRVELAKEMLVYNELTLSEIAFELGYSSVHHLSAQFKKVTGLTPTHFRKIGTTRRSGLDRV